MRLIINRFAYTTFGTLGEFSLSDGSGLLQSGYTVELPWVQNKKNESCIPEGVYTAELHTSPRFGPTIHVLGVPDRTEILVHPANSMTDLNGCIGVGNDYGWWQKREELAVWDSTKTLTKMLSNISEDEITINIKPWRLEYP